MDQKLLKEHIDRFLAHRRKAPQKFEADARDRAELVRYYRSFTADRIRQMTPEDVYEYLADLWAMQIWGNKHYVVDKVIDQNGLEGFRTQLAELVWGNASIADRWDAFRTGIKGLGAAMTSEILCKSHPDKYMLWNRRAYAALRYLQVEGLPRYDYQLTGEVYSHLCSVGLEIARQLEDAGFEETSLLSVDYFIWEELQVEANLSRMHDKKETEPEPTPTENAKKWIHNDVRDKVRDIGQWLGFEADIEKRVSAGSRVDAIWEATIGNMGRVIYVFEAQTGGSIDSLVVNLLKSLNNPAVQGVVAISDSEQLEKIKKHAGDVKELKDKLRYWDYEEVLQVHESLEFVNSKINHLGLVPHGF